MNTSRYAVGLFLALALTLPACASPAPSDDGEREESDALKTCSNGYLAVMSGAPGPLTTVAKPKQNPKYVLITLNPAEWDYTRKASDPITIYDTMTTPHEIVISISNDSTGGESPGVPAPPIHVESALGVTPHIMYDTTYYYEGYWAEATPGTRETADSPQLVRDMEVKGLYGPGKDALTSIRLRDFHTDCRR